MERKEEVDVSETLHTMFQHICRQHMRSEILLIVFCGIAIGACVASAIRDLAMGRYGWFICFVVLGTWNIFNTMKAIGRLLEVRKSMREEQACYDALVSCPENASEL